MMRSPVPLVAAALISMGSAHAASADSAAAAFKPYVVRQISQCLVATERLRAAVAAEDVPAAQQAWLAARGGWEQSEVVGNELFPELDTAIDAWPNAEKGFHAIEATLFGAHSAKVLPATEELLRNLQDFDRRLRAATLTSQALINGSARLAYEIGESKAGGGESPFSGNSLAEIGANVAALKAVYAQVFVPHLKKANLKLAKVAGDHLEQLGSLVAVPRLVDLDQRELRSVSEAVAADLVLIARETGLEKPNLGN